MTKLDSRRKGYVAEEELPRGIQRCLLPLPAQEIRSGGGGRENDDAGPVRRLLFGTRVR